MTKKAPYESTIRNTIKQIIKAITPMKEDFKIFKYYLKNNKVFIIWILSYVLILWAKNAFTINSLMFIIILYYFSIKVSLSELGERLLRATYDCRNLATSKEKSRLLPIFKEVYTKALEKSPYLEKDIELYIIDTITPNAFSMGRKSIVVTKGLMDIMTDEEIKGTLAHEFGHMANGDTIIGMIFTIGNFLFLWSFLLIRLILTKIEGEYGSILEIVRTIVEFTIMVLNLIGVLLLMPTSRKREYKADLYSYELGYGNNLITGLYKLYDYTLSAPKKLFGRMQDTHPRVAYRIGQLETMFEESTVF